MFKNNTFLLLFSGLILFTLPACNKYLDIIPDNVATIDNAFTRRNEAEKFLFTCYSYMPKSADPTGNPGLSAADEWSLIWPTVDNALNPSFYNIARGNQGIVDPYGNFWDGTQSKQPLFQAIRDCNIFLEDIDRVPDMLESEKARWVAEVKVLKAYYIFYLVRMYGPIPLPRTNLPISASEDEVKVYRDPVDSCFDYMVSLIDEAREDLPEIITDEAAELGRITKPIALSLKAKMLVTAASPFFNGNTDYNNFKDNRGTVLFNQQVDPAKWQKAVSACKEAVDLCQSVGLHLYYYQQNVAQYELSPETYTKMSIRSSFTEKWNPEIIWANTQSMASSIQTNSIPRGLDPATLDNTNPRGQIAPPLKIVSQFYTKNGLPITDDPSWNYAERFSLRVGTEAEKYDIGQGYTTAQINFDREPRFYADLGFDGGVWYGQGKYDDTKSFVLQAKAGQAASQHVNFAYSTTGYWVKKYVHYQDVINSTTLTIQSYPWPEMRLADLYLLYAESLNEANKTPTAATYQYLDSVRLRAGIPTAEDSWKNYSNNPTKYTTQQGLREIIHQERLIELAFEGQRLWDLNRWKESIRTLNGAISGWDIEQSDAVAYYREKLIFNQTFTLKNYLWPIRDADITVNRNLVQNPGW
jgi:hypothetical protein